MLRLTIRPRETAFVAPANPSRLHAPPSFFVDIYASHRVRSYVALILATLLVASISVAASEVQRQVGNTPLPSTIAAALVLAMAAILPVFSRRIARLIVHRLKPGMPLPTVGDRTTEDPKAESDYQASLFRVGRQRINPQTINLAIRETDPNVAMRLERLYPRNADTPLTFQTMDAEDDLARFHEMKFPARASTKRLAKQLKMHHQERGDLWPLVRLALARILHDTGPQASHPRTLDESQEASAPSGYPYYLAFKLNLLPLAFWLLILALAISLPQLATTGEFRKQASLVVSILVFLWMVCTIAHNRALYRKWRDWLQSSSQRPFGSLPLFIYCPQNDRQYKWEEIDDRDFKVDMQEHVLNLANTFTVTNGTFVAIAMIYVGWFA